MNTRGPAGQVLQLFCWILADIPFAISPRFFLPNPIWQTFPLPEFSSHFGSILLVVLRPISVFSLTLAMEGLVELMEPFHVSEKKYSSSVRRGSMIMTRQGASEAEVTGGEGEDFHNAEVIH